MPRKHLLLIAAALLPSVTLAAATLKQATQQLDRNYYESAGATLRAGVSGGDPASVSFLLGRAYLRNAQLQHVLAHSSMETASRYLQKLATQSGRDRSRMAALYYGEFLIEAGKRPAGITQLQNFLAQADLPKVQRQVGEIRLAAARNLALPPAGGLEPEARTELAAALVRAKPQEAVAVLDKALEELGKGGNVRPMRAITNAIGVYTRAGLYDKALELMTSEGVGRYSYQETIGKTKTLNFYDAALLGNLATLYLAAGEQQMERARADARLKGMAGYFLAEAWMAHDQPEKAGALLANLGELPAAYGERAAMMQAAVDVRTGQTLKGNNAFTALGGKHAQDPALLGEVLMWCVQAVKAKCDGPASAGERLAATGQGERFRGLHRAVGTLHAAAGRPERALQNLETARDKSNKNRIDANDPLLLVQLADLYLATKSFSENLEIYFELSKEFPAVRQLQEMGQGIYSMEYRSAGDVKIF